MKLRRSGTLAFCLLLLPTLATAQACLGNPIAPGRMSLEAGADFPHEFRAYVARLTARSARVTVQGEYRLVTSDTLFNAGNEGGIRAATEIRYGGLSACPVVGVTYATYTEPFRVIDEAGNVTVVLDRSTYWWQVPLLLGAGWPVSAGSVQIVPSARAGVVWFADGWRVQETGESFARRRWPLFHELSMTMAWRNVFVSGGRSYLDVPRAKPTFRLAVGFATP